MARKFRRARLRSVAGSERPFQVREPSKSLAEFGRGSARESRGKRLFPGILECRPRHQKCFLPSP